MNKIEKLLYAKYLEGKSFKLLPISGSHYLSVGWLTSDFEHRDINGLQEKLNKYLEHYPRIKLAVISLGKATGDAELVVSMEILHRIPDIIRLCLDNGENISLSLKDRVELQWNNLNYLIYLGKLKKTLKEIDIPQL